MGKWKLFGALIALLALCACGAGGSGGKAEELALTLRGEYLALTDWDAMCVVEADYGQRVYSFRLAAKGRGEEVVLTLLAPEEVAGMTARLTGAGGRLEFEGLTLETGDLGDGLSPLMAAPLLVESVRSGYMDVCALETGEEPLLRVDCRDPEREPGEGRGVTLWLLPETGALTRGEVSVDGWRVLTCVFEEFVRHEGAEHGAGDHENLGGN